MHAGRLEALRVEVLINTRLRLAGTHCETRVYEKQKKARGRGPRLDGCPVHSTTETLESVERERERERERASDYKGVQL